MALDQLFTWGPANAGQLLTSTNAKRPKKDIQNAVFNAIPTFEYLNKAGRVMIDGGTSVIVPLEVAKNSTAQSYDGYDAVNIAA